LEKDVAANALKELMENGKLLALEDGNVTVSSDLLLAALPHWNALRDKTMQIISAYHQNYPLRRGIPREELKSRLKLTPKAFNAVTELLFTRHLLLVTGNLVAKPEHEIKFDNGQQAKVEALKRKFEQNPFSPPSVKECQAEVGEDVLNALVELNELVAVSADVIFRKQDYEAMIAKTRETLQQNGQITLAEVRDLFDTSRKYAQALLEHLDANGITMRDGDFRKLRH
jgi:selenocysteine-specific elongation factor